jgi:hypothetical protein
VYSCRRVAGITTDSGKPSTNLKNAVRDVVREVYGGGRQYSYLLEPVREHLTSSAFVLERLAFDGMYSRASKREQASSDPVKLE